MEGQGRTDREIKNDWLRCEGNPVLMEEVRKMGIYEYYEWIESMEPIKKAKSDSKVKFSRQE